MKNVGTADRVVRLLLAVALVVAAFTALDLMSGNVAGIIAAVVALVLIVTSTCSFCPAYKIVGVRTCKNDPSAGGSAT